MRDLHRVRVPYADQRPLPELTRRDVDPIGVDRDGSDVILVLGKEPLLIRRNVHDDSEPSGVVDDVPVGEVAEVVPAVLRAVSMNVVELELDLGLFIVMKLGLDESAWLPDLPNPRLDHQDLITGIFLLELE